MNLEEYISQIVAKEWAMFDQVQNAGGRASCQNNPREFEINRRSQLVTWPKEALESYYYDLDLAARTGRNLLTEKYAHMMESTYPTEYAQFADQLPQPSNGTMQQINEMVAIHLAWQREAEQQYPNLRAKGRPLTTAEDSPYQTSFETYLRSEYKTYSATTIALLYDYTLATKNAGNNLALATLAYTMNEYGFPSLEVANKALQK